MRIINIRSDQKHYHSIPLCACIGYFDGMHRGHQELIRKTVELAEEHCCESALITFDPDPWVTLKGMQDVKHITTMRQRMNKAVSMGINNIVVLRFTEQMSRLEPEAFVSDILGQLNLKGIVCGFDFRYGYKGCGNSESLAKSASFEVCVIPAVEDEQGKISSTRISECITEGRIPEANRMLGYEYEIEGMVIHGRSKGTSMGFPTANMRISDEYLIPKKGVYACYASVNGTRYRAMLNIGHNPTMNYSENISVECHLFGFSGNLYGKMLTVHLIRYLRPEIKFRNAHNLIMQLDQDTRDTGRILDAYERSLSSADEVSAGK